MTINTKTQISYYGGKQNMLKEILPLIPAHKLYCEPFFGGGAVYFAKQPSEIEVINDKNDFVINFYRVLKTRFDELKLEVEASLSSRSIHRKAGYILKSPELYDELKKAWALWYLANFSFSGKLTGGWKYDRTENKDCQVLQNKKFGFSKALVNRIELTQIECEDACKVIRCRDHGHSFFYVDPPYINAEQGHYKGYTEAHYTTLLDTLCAIKGKFLLSSFDNEILRTYAGKHGWNVATFKKINYATRNWNNDTLHRQYKTELLITNYEISAKQISAFPFG